MVARRRVRFRPNDTADSVVNKRGCGERAGARAAARALEGTAARALGEKRRGVNLEAPAQESRQVARRAARNTGQPRRSMSRLARLKARARGRRSGRDETSVDARRRVDLRKATKRALVRTIFEQHIVRDAKAAETLGQVSDRAGTLVEGIGAGDHGDGTRDVRVELCSGSGVYIGVRADSRGVAPASGPAGGQDSDTSSRGQQGDSTEERVVPREKCTEVLAFVFRERRGRGGFDPGAEDTCTSRRGTRPAKCASELVALSGRPGGEALRGVDVEADSGEGAADVLDGRGGVGGAGRDNGDVVGVRVDADVGVRGAGGDECRVDRGGERDGSSRVALARAFAAPGELGVGVAAVDEQRRRMRAPDSRDPAVCVVGGSLCGLAGGAERTKRRPNCCHRRGRLQPSTAGR